MVNNFARTMRSDYISSFLSEQGELESPKDRPDIWTPIISKRSNAICPVCLLQKSSTKFPKLLAGVIFSPVWRELGNDCLEFTI